MIYEKSIREGYGSHRLATLLNGMNIKTHNGSGFQCNTINRILKNRSYCGYYIAGDIVSPHLSGNVFCSHCGSHLIATSYVDSYKRADGSEPKTRRHRYICCNKARHRGVCEGQSGYVSDRVDGAVNTIVLEYLSRIKTTAKSIALEKLDFYYEQFRGWAEEFEDASLEQRKMIVCQLVREVNISRGYELEIVLDVNYEQFLSA